VLVGLVVVFALDDDESLFGHVLQGGLFEIILCQNEELAFDLPMFILHLLQLLILWFLHDSGIEILTEPPLCLLVLNHHDQTAIHQPLAAHPVNFLLFLAEEAQSGRAHQTLLVERERE